MRSRRALLYMPGDDWRKIKKAVSLTVDSICMDLEDGVAQNQKNEARETIGEALRTLDFGSKEVLVRINPVASDRALADLEAVMPGRPDGVVLPKTSTAMDVIWASERIADEELAHGWPSGSIRLLAIIETARGLVNLREIAASDARLDSLIFGAEDLANDLGAVRTPEGWEVFYARSAVVVHAAAANLMAIDMLNTEFRSLEGLHEEARMGARMGFLGKQVIHPNQIEPVQSAFTPSPEEVEHARRVVAEHAAQQSAGKGAFELDGKMVDQPVVLAAERVLARARAAGLLGE